MRKLLGSVLALFTLCSIGHAQTTISVDYQLGIPTTPYSGDMKLSIAGVNLKYGMHLDDYLRLNIGTGFYAVPFESLNIEGVQRATSDAVLNIIPVTLGAEFYFLGTKADKTPSKIKPYIGIDLGWAYTMQNKTDLAPATNRNNFIFAPTFGIAYEMSDGLHLFGAVRNNMIIYQYRDIINWDQPFQLVGVNLGVQFTF
ncbi:MAG: outer membrane beta-barrel protein [Bacteroidota bacterium]